MDFDYCLQQMASNAVRIRALVDGVNEQQARWKPDPQSWSILEVVCHLLDEERKDFRVRLDFTLRNPGGTWPRIDPEGWVTEHNYNEQDLALSLQEFLAEREASLAWLETLVDPDWDTTYDADWGSITAGDLFAAWVAHDLLHMRQLVALHWLYTEKQVDPYSPHYAGEW